MATRLTAVFTLAEDVATFDAHGFTVALSAKLRVDTSHVSLRYAAASLTVTALVTLHAPPEDAAVAGARASLAAPLSELRDWLTPSLLTPPLVSSAPLLIADAEPPPLGSTDPAALARGSQEGGLSAAAMGWVVAGSIIGACTLLACGLLYWCNVRTQRDVQMIEMRNLSSTRDLTRLSSLEESLPGLTELEQWSKDQEPVLSPAAAALMSPRGGGGGGGGASARGNSFRWYSEVSADEALNSPRPSEVSASAANAPSVVVLEDVSISAQSL